MEELLEQVILIVLNSGVPVLLANLAKNFFPGMQGKTDKIVNVMIMALFGFGWFYGEFYDPEFLLGLLPDIGYKMKDAVELLNGILVLIVSLGIAPKIYGLVKGKVPVFGKSFSK